MNTDQLSMVPAHNTIQAVYGLVSGAQDFTKAQQVMASAVLFSELCKELRLEPGQMLDAARRVTAHAQNHFSVELVALRQYIAAEFKPA